MFISGSGFLDVLVILVVCRTTPVLVQRLLLGITAFITHAVSAIEGTGRDEESELYLNGWNEVGLN